MTQIRIKQFFSMGEWSDWQDIEVLMEKAFVNLIYVVRTVEEQDTINGYSLIYGHHIATEVDPEMQYRPNSFSFQYRFLEVRS